MDEGFPGGATDWLLNGEPIRRKEQKLLWSKLDWSRAYLDKGPSPAGNPGPYWHVPWNFDGEKLWARLYPKLMMSRHLPLLQRIARDAALTPPPSGEM
jgi:hypothetical protein